ncbi:MAG: hypothetical protein J5697_03410, partial [Clostridia bacterium]|nr:hypothetical protein [Clostridia bacterium]
MRNAVKKTIGIVVLAFVMALSVCAGIAMSVAKAAVFTNNLFYSSGVNLTNNTSITQGGRNGTLASPLRSGAYLKVDRDLVGLTSLEFGIADPDAMDDFVVSFNGEYDGFSVDIEKSGNGFVATVVESGEVLGEASIADAKNIALSFDANGKEVALNGVKVCGVRSVMPTYEMVIDFESADGTGDDIILYAINEHSLAQPIMTNRSGPTIFSEFSVKGVVNNFYT